MLLRDEREFRSASQWARNFTESWWAQRGYCFSCESATPPRRMPANNQATAFLCESCGHPYELKSTRGPRHGVIVDGAYAAMMRQIAANRTPSFLLMRYTRNENVLAVAAVHRTLITAHAIEPRKPLAPTARRAGWIGCNIRMDRVPLDAKIAVVENERFLNRERVREQFQRVGGLAGKRAESRGWMAALLTLLRKLPNQRFTLKDVYRFEPELSAMFPDNHHVKAKVRQQLQVLRDAGLVEFVDKRGSYRLTGNPMTTNLLR